MASVGLHLLLVLGVPPDERGRLPNERLKVQRWVLDDVPLRKPAVDAEACVLQSVVVVAVAIDEPRCRAWRLALRCDFFLGKELLH